MVMEVPERGSPETTMTGSFESMFAMDRIISRPSFHLKLTGNRKKIAAKR
jgi:hypothetical protein